LHSVMPSVPVGVAVQGLSAQHLWNREWRYRACAHCMRSIETADEMAARLSNGHAPLSDGRRLCAGSHPWLRLGHPSTRYRGSHSQLLDGDVGTGRAARGSARDGMCRMWRRLLLRRMQVGGACPRAHRQSTPSLVRRLSAALPR
jgi:hypothetical protein